VKILGEDTDKITHQNVEATGSGRQVQRRLEELNRRTGAPPHPGSPTTTAASDDDNSPLGVVILYLFQLCCPHHYCCCVALTSSSLSMNRWFIQRRRLSTDSWSVEKVFLHTFGVRRGEGEAAEERRRAPERGPGAGAGVAGAAGTRISIQ